jgi:hypothetical protein
MEQLAISGTLFLIDQVVPLRRSLAQEEDLEMRTELDE